MDPHLRKRNETEFLGLARERFEQERLSPTKEQTPKRLYDIYTGQFTEDTAEKAFVIVSYVWSPEELPKFPKLGKYYKTEYFEGMITCASKIKNKQNVPLLEVDGNLEAKLSGIRLPDFDGQPVRARREYFQEVFVLLSAEAVRRGIKYVWMDSLCIDQKNLLEKAEEIPHMAAYYAQAVCCVVVSEMLRRRYSNEWEYRGRDEFAEKSGLGSCDDNDIMIAYQKRWGLHDEIVGWIIGFHELRLWVFQETYFATDVVHRGGNIRINTREVLDPGIPVENLRYRASTRWHLAGDEQREEVLLWLRQSYLEKVQDRLPCGQKRRALPFANSLDVDQTLDILQRQQRGAKMPQDHYYSILSLYPAIIRYSLPVQYNVSKIAIYTTLTYLRVCSGEMEVLGPLEEEPEKGSHLIENAPSWLPKHYSRRYSNVEIIRFSLFCVNENHALEIHGPYLHISDADLRNDEQSESPSSRVMQLLIQPRHPKAHTSDTRTPYQWTRLDMPIQRLHEAENIRNLHAQLLQSARKGCASMICLGSRYFDRVRGHDDLLWLVLTSNDDRQTWFRRGWTSTKDILEYTLTKENRSREICNDTFIVC